MNDPQALFFADDGETPNNPRLPLLLYKGAVSLDGARDPALPFETVFARHGWRHSWRNGIFAFRHFHPSAHEVLGIARGRARVEFGGAGGQEVELAAGDVAVLPAGTGHRRVASSPDLLVVGAYPSARDTGHLRAGESAHAASLAAIAGTPLPEQDPLFGKDGPLIRLWS